MYFYFCDENEYDFDVGKLENIGVCLVFWYDDRLDFSWSRFDLGSVFLVFNCVYNDVFSCVDLCDFKCVDIFVIIYCVLVVEVEWLIDKSCFLREKWFFVLVILFFYNIWII